MKSRTVWTMEDSAHYSGPFRVMELEVDAASLHVKFREANVHIFEGKSHDGMGFQPVSPQDRFERTVDSYTVQLSSLYERNIPDEDDETDKQRARRLHEERWRKRWMPLAPLLGLCAGQTSEAAGDALLSVVLAAEMDAHRSGDLCRLRDLMPETFQRQVQWEVRRVELHREEERRREAVLHERRINRVREVLDV